MKRPKVAAIVLAAGASLRFGQPKQLLPWGKKTLLQHVVDAVLASSIGHVIVVLGYQAGEIEASLGDRPVKVVVNDAWEEGLASSVRAGLRTIGPDVEAGLFILGDQPGITSQFIDELIRRHRQSCKPIVAPFYRGRRGNPVLFARSLFPELMALRGDQGGRAVVGRHQAEVERIEVDSESFFIDIDTPKAYERFLAGRSMDDLNTLRSIQSLIIDMDGVLYRGDRPMPGASEFIRLLQQQGVPFVLLTNNSTRTARQYVTKLQKMDIEVEEGVVLTSGEATAIYLEKVASPGARIYLIGEDGVRLEVAKRGFTIAEEGVTFVVVGMDTQLSYEKLKKAALAIRRGARFIGTNPDRTFPTPEGLAPGNGAILAALEAATDVKPFVTGKPQRAIFELALEKMNATRDKAAVIGDRLDTDIVGGIDAGLTTILLLSGIARSQDVERSSVKPDLIFADMHDLYEAWRECHLQQPPKEG